MHIINNSVFHLHLAISRRIEEVWSLYWMAEALGGEVPTARVPSALVYNLQNLKGCYVQLMQIWLKCHAHAWCRWLVQERVRASLCCHYET